MGKYSKSFFENPYIEEGNDQTKYSAEVIMDEARQKWRTGSWRAKSEAFDIERSQLAAADNSENEPPQRPAASRFELDIQRDLTGDTISLRKLSELDYSASYRPKGDIEERIVGPRSTLQRYDVLAGELEAPPEDISFVSDAEARRERDEQKGEVRSGVLRRDTRRLETSVDVRRSELIKMLPDHDDGKAKAIVKEAVTRRRREDAELGRTGKRKTKYRFTHEDDLPKAKKGSDTGLEEDIPMSELAGTRFERLPQNTGMESSLELPEFATEARYWSQITGENPTWSEIAAHSLNTVPQDQEPHEFDGRYIRPDEDSGSEYAITATRARVRSNEAGEFKNEYLKEANIDPERIKEIMGHRYRGRWIPPEFFADDALVEDYFNALSSGQTGGEDFVTWAYNRKQAEHYQRQMAEQARRQYVKMLKTPHTGRRRSPFVQAPPPRQSRSREDMLGEYEQARRMGYEQGSTIKKKNRSEEAGQYPGPFGYQYPMFRIGMTPPAGQKPAGQYQGLYPDLFEGTNPQPQVHYQQGYQQMQAQQYAQRHAAGPMPYGAPPGGMTGSPVRQQGRPMHPAGAAVRPVQHGRPGSVPPGTVRRRNNGGQ